MLPSINPQIRPDGRQSQTAAAIQKGVCRHLRAAGFATLTEFTLASGRRVDVIGLSPSGQIWIVEIKSSLEDFRADLKWPEYRDFCDRLYFAITTDLAPEIMPAEAGLIVADAWGAEVQRDPAEHLLHASRRKAMTLSFARSAALRLHGLYDPEMM
ncbi:MmcB family DNA repair protein [Aestuariivirga sp. YIM B02566]|uniref:MmcB family DNA repair protein n=1 Tax=Taklimakanibacter albus TaxID=2800327 RepID=A0ACC5RFL4_9HYPH|nr:MmcB family DNA repair protein [Aestuariivirga sp. YIM B02566]MBK1871514.1 MmcB family DNA repair protein [Aestuariivirga sp. YIM B02566]